MTLKVMINNPHFQYQQWEFQDAYLVQILQVITQTSQFT